MTADEPGSDRREGADVRLAARTGVEDVLEAVCEERDETTTCNTAGKTKKHRRGLRQNIFLGLIT